MAVGQRLASWPSAATTPIPRSITKRSSTTSRGRRYKRTWTAETGPSAWRPTQPGGVDARLLGYCFITPAATFRTAANLTLPVGDYVVDAGFGDITNGNRTCNVGWELYDGTDAATDETLEASQSVWQTGAALFGDMGAADPPGGGYTSAQWFDQSRVESRGVPITVAARAGNAQGIQLRWGIGTGGTVTTINYLRVFQA